MQPFRRKLLFQQRAQRLQLAARVLQPRQRLPLERAEHLVEAVQQGVDPRPPAQFVERLADVRRDRSAAVLQVHQLDSGALRPYGSERARSVTGAVAAVVVRLAAGAVAGEQADRVVGVDQRHGAAAPRPLQVVARARDAGRIAFDAGQVPRPTLLPGGDDPTVRARRRVRRVRAAFGRPGGLVPGDVAGEALDLGPRPVVLATRLGEHQRHADVRGVRGAHHPAVSDPGAFDSQHDPPHHRPPRTFRRHPAPASGGAGVAIWPRTPAPRAEPHSVQREVAP